MNITKRIRSFLLIGKPDIPKFKISISSPLSKLGNEAVLEAYKKHASALQANEERQERLILLMLAIYSATATLLVSSKDGLHDLPVGVYWVLAGTVASMLGYGFWYIHELHDARQSIRYLLVRCEQALGFYEPGAFLSDALYRRSDEHELTFPNKGQWLARLYYLVLFSGVGLCLLVFFIARSSLRPTPREIAKETQVKSSAWIGAEIQAIQDDVNRPGAYTYRVKLPKTYNARLEKSGALSITVLSGILNYDSGGLLRKKKHNQLPAGSYWSVSAEEHPSLWTSEDTVILVRGVGPAEVEFSPNKSPPPK